MFALHFWLVFLSVTTLSALGEGHMLPNLYCSLIFQIFRWKYGDLAAAAEPPENKAGCTVFQATLCHSLAVRREGVFGYSCPAPVPVRVFISYGISSSHLTSCHSEKWSQLGAAGAKFSDVVALMWCCHIRFSVGRAQRSLEVVRLGINCNWSP